MRIKKYYTGDGMFYLYNKDQVNIMMTSGQQLIRILQQESQLKNLIEQILVEQLYQILKQLVELDLMINMVALYAIIKFYENLKANKSYFIMDDKIVFLGSKIEYNSKNEVQTIIDNRKLSDKLKYEIYLDGKKLILVKIK